MSKKKKKKIEARRNERKERFEQIAKKMNESQRIGKNE